MSKQDKSNRPSKSKRPAPKKTGKEQAKDKNTPSQAPTQMSGRIAKILARAGVASRREVERMIEEGRVKVNGKLVETPATIVSMTDKFEVDNKPIASIERTRLWLYHKPGGLVTTNHDPEGRPTVFERLPEELPRVMSIGRLDINTEGLLLLTNDGGLARTLELPSTGWLRRYRVRAHGKITQEQLDALQDGIAVEGVLYGAIEATLDRVQGSNVWITMGLREGKNREIKVVLGALGLDVNRLIRLSYGPFQLGELGEGKVLEVKGRMLRDQLGNRLIEESGANFDAPLREHESQAEREKADEWKPRKKLTEAERKERARDRLSTRPDDFKMKRASDSPRGKFDDEERPKRKFGPRNRGANVWMGQGARPKVKRADDDNNKPYGQKPETGNWHRPKDKLDPQKSFRRPRASDEAKETKQANAKPKKAYGKSTSKNTSKSGTNPASKPKGSSYLSGAKSGSKPKANAPMKKGKPNADRRR